MVESVLFIALCFVVLAMLVGLSAAVSAPIRPKDAEKPEDAETDAEAAQDRSERESL